MNDLLRQRTSTSRFVSLFWGFYDPDTLLLRYINAGYLPPALVRRKENGYEIFRLEKGGPILGILPDAHYRQGEIRVQPGDLLVIYSDGIVESSNGSEEEFGEERLAGMIQTYGDQPAVVIRDRILKQVQTFQGKREPQDDMTLVVIRIGERACCRLTPDPDVSTLAPVVDAVA